jgi:hypothetical protein
MGMCLSGMFFCYILFSAVIKRNRNEVNSNHRANNVAPSPVYNGKHVLFCNPNGVYIQFFAVENSYIREYLRQVIFKINKGLSNNFMEL